MSEPCGEHGGRRRRRTARSCAGHGNPAPLARCRGSRATHRPRYPNGPCWPPWACRRPVKPRPAKRSRIFGRGRPRGAFPEEIVATADREVRIPLASAADWHLELESGRTQEGSDEREIALTLPVGLHRLTIGDETCLVIATPERAPAVGAFTGRGKGLGTLGCPLRPPLEAQPGGRRLPRPDRRSGAGGTPRRRLHRHQSGPRPRNGERRLQSLFPDLPHRAGAGPHRSGRGAGIRVLCRGHPADGGANRRPGG